MATYADIERLRTTKRHYVKYDYDKIDPAFTDMYDHTSNRCRYCVKSPTTGVTKNDVIRANMKQHDLYNADSKKLSFKDVEDALLNTMLDKVDDEYLNSVLSYFKNLTTYNDNKDVTCRCMLMACASIDFEALIADINNANGNKTEISRILQSLTLEANTVAVNGLFSKLFSVVCSSSKANGNFKDVDPELEKLINKMYEKTMFKGKDNNHPLSIPQDPSKVFNVLTSLYTQVKSVENMKGLSSEDVKKQIIKPFDSIINKEIDKQLKNREKE